MPKIRYTIKAEFYGCPISKRKFIGELPKSDDYELAEIQGTEELLLIFTDKAKREQYLSAIHALKIPEKVGKCVLFAGTMGVFKRDTDATTESLQEPDRVNALVKSMKTDNERLEYLNACFEGVCRDCGSLDPKCQCWNDE